MLYGGKSRQFFSVWKTVTLKTVFAPQNWTFWSTESLQYLLLVTKCLQSFLTVHNNSMQNQAFLVYWGLQLSVNSSIIWVIFHQQIPVSLSGTFALCNGSMNLVQWPWFCGLKFSGFSAARSHASAAAYAVMWCLSICLLCSYILSKRINVSSKFLSSGSHTILVFPCQTLWQYFGWNPSNGSVNCRWGRQKSQFWANIWLHRVLRTLGAASAIHSAATDRGELMTLVAGKQRSLFMAGDNNKVFMTRSLNITSKTNCMQW